MITRPTAILTLGTAVLGVYVLAFAPGETERSFSAIPFSEPKQITALEISTSAGSIALGRDSGVWTMTAPVDDRADTTKIEEIVEALCKLTRLQDVEGEGAPSPVQMGLGSGAMTVRITDSNGGSGVLQFGNEAGANGAIYARWEDGTPFACWRDARDLAAVSAESLRDRKLLAISPEQMRRVKLNKASDASLVIERLSADAPWQITKPLRTNADPKAVATRLAIISAIKANGFIDEPNGDVAAAFADGTTTISVRRLGAAGSVDIELARSPDGESAFAKISDRAAVFRIDPRFIAVMTLNPNDLRDRRLLPFNPKSVLNIDIAAKPSFRVSLEQGSNGWQLVENGAKRPANRQRIYDLLKALAAEEVQEFVADAVAPEDLAKWGLDSPTLSITLDMARQSKDQPFGEDGNPNVILVPVTIHVKGQVAEDQNVINYFATVKDTAGGNGAGENGDNGPAKASSTVVRLKRSFPSLVPIQPLDFRSLYLWQSFESSMLRRLSVSSPPSAPLELEYLAETNDWTGKVAGDDVSARIDGLNGLQLVQQLSLPLRATRWLSGSNPEARKALLMPIKHIEFVLADPAGKEYTFELDIAPINPDGPNALYYARVKGSSDICVIDRETYAVLNLPLIKAKSEAIPAPAPLPVPAPAPVPEPAPPTPPPAED